MRKAKTYIEHFSLTGECSTFFPGCVLPEVMVLRLIQWFFCIVFILFIPNMVKFKTKFTLGFSFELEQVRETVRSISKFLKVSKETIRTRLRKMT